MAVSARPQPAPEPPPVAEQVPDFGTYRLEQLDACQCRYPCSSRGTEHRFCGRPAVRHHPDRPAVWCVKHRDIVFVDWRPGGQVLRRAGRA
ncbi:hypothetical protein MMSR116_29375 [Methylobacterium mesophilicum SR1.6/6]|uniref:Uncharacterized protein n=1 Tax=Methylobacterium mesophilicum SR1.6/6 TaxID=908290 RepID=A0A6B9FYH4_9HYPH|nr:hypothetical protein [Methylobacterium mesophilicum]QGY05548.1 hypothetical protein MMSR116_29375 [Methylobacterium mesophilicum SR1.6/6]